MQSNIRDWCHNVGSFGSSLRKNTLTEERHDLNSVGHLQHCSGTLPNMDDWVQPYYISESWFEPCSPMSVSNQFANNDVNLRWGGEWEFAGGDSAKWIVSTCFHKRIGRDLYILILSVAPVWGLTNHMPATSRSSCSGLVSWCRLNWWNKNRCRWNMSVNPWDHWFHNRASAKACSCELREQKQLNITLQYII